MTKKVDNLTKVLSEDGYQVLSGPRTTQLRHRILKLSSNILFITASKSVYTLKMLVHGKKLCCELSQQLFQFIYIAA